MATKSAKKKLGRPRKAPLVEVKPDNPPHRPPFKPTEKQRDMVIGLTGLLVAPDVIARMINDGEGIDVRTLRKYFSRELEIGRENTVAGLKATMLGHAQRGSIRAGIYLLDRLGGLEFSPRLRLGGMGDDAPPIAFSADAKITVYIPENGRDKKPTPAEAEHAAPEPPADPDDPDGD